MGKNTCSTPLITSEQQMSNSLPNTNRQLTRGFFVMLLCEHNLKKHPGPMDLITTKQNKLPSIIHRLVQVVCPVMQPIFFMCTGRRPRPQRIILVRHGQSEGNIDESAYTCIPDSKIALTEVGWKQAVLCGKKIRKIIEGDNVDDWQVYFYVSPYRRTLQTLRGMGMAFERERIAGVREEPRLREQDFGNFQNRERMQLQKAARIRYGRFFYRFPNGESAADVYDRITGFRETLRSDIDVGRFQRPEARSKSMNLILVSHGLTLRVFLMRWYKWTVEQFEGLWNFGNTGMLVMQLGPGGRYSLTMHHTHDELRALGMTDDMIADQEWQKGARPGDLNPDWDTSGPSFFTHFDAMERGLNLEEIPPDIVRVETESIAGRIEPPVAQSN
ncbi:unnamed protein product [Sphagnum tenellum]